MISARDEFDSQTQQTLLRTMYDKYCNQEIKSITSTKTGTHSNSTTLNQHSNQVTQTGNARNTAGQHRHPVSKRRAQHNQRNAGSRPFTGQNVYGLYRSVATTSTQSVASTSGNSV